MATTPHPSEYAPRAPFLPYHNRPQRWATLVTHRRAGKTIALVNDLTIAARTPIPLSAPTYAYIGPTFTQAKRIAWAYLKQYTKPWWTKLPSESELKVYLPRDTTIYCLGADNADSLRGMYLDGVVADEYALWKPSVFPQVLRPALSDRVGWATFASTPKGKNLFHDQYRLALKNPETHFLLTLRASASGLIPAPELADLQRHMDPEEYAQEYECSFDAALKGAIYANEVNELFRRSGALSLSPLYDPSLDTHFVYDLGFTDSTVRIAYQLPPLTGAVHIVNVLARSGVDIFTHIDDLHSFGGPIGNIHLPHDARARNLQTGKSIVEQFIAEGFMPHVVANHHVHDGISAVRRLFPRLVLDNSPLADGETVCGEFIEAMKTYHREWDEDNLCFKEQPVHDWSSDFMDALRYLAIITGDYFPSGRSSSNELQSARDARNRVWRPSVGYNLETLHADAGLLTKRDMP